MNYLYKAVLVLSLSFSFALSFAGRHNLPETVAARGPVNGGTADVVGGGTRAVRPEGFGEGTPSVEPEGCY